MMRWSAMVVLIACSSVSAAVTVSSPVNGRYRIGQYTPVAIDAPAAKVIEVRGEGLMSLLISGQGRPTHGVFPMFVFDRPGETLTISIDGVAQTVPLMLRAVGVDERLVGIAGDATATAEAMFPGKTIVPVSLDPADALAGSAAGWDGLDGVVLDGDVTLRDETLRFLLAKGVKFAARWSQPPEAKYPWKHEGEWWRLEYEPLGPKEWMTEAAYAPVRNWRPGALARTRINVVILGVMFALAAIGVGLLRGKTRGVAMTMVAIGAVGAFWLFAGRQTAVREAAGGIAIFSEGLQQSDSWGYQTSVRETNGFVGWNGLTRPMPMSLEHLRSFDVRLSCTGDGRPYLFVTRLAPGRMICFYNRGVNPNKDEVIALPTSDSALRALAPIFYAAPGAQVIGEGTKPAGGIPYEQRWPVVIVDRRKAGE